MIAIALPASDSEPAADKPLTRRAHRPPAPPRDAAAVALDAFIDELGGSASLLRNRHIAAGHLDRFLGRPATVADLADGPLTGLLGALKIAGKRQDTTRAKIREDLRRLGRLAAERGLLEYEPIIATVRHARKPKSTPWTVAELNRMLGSARTMPDTVADVLPAGQWWPALLLLLLDTGEPAAAVLAAALDAYDRRAATIALGSFVYSLHPSTVEALDAIAIGQADRAKLFPWKLDGGHPPFYMLYRQYRWLLWRAGLPHVAANMFCRLQQTTRRRPGIIGQVDPRCAFRPREGKLKLPRPRDRRHALARANGELPPKAPVGGPSDANADGRPQVYFIRAFAPERTLDYLFQACYRPLRLAAGAPATARKFATTIARFRDYLGCEPTIEQLTEDRIESFAAWTFATGRAPATANSRTRELVALANFAWKKRKTNYQIREVEKMKENKRSPQAWTVEEIGLMLRAAAALPGTIGGIPAGTWWPLLILTIYDSGLRISAALSLRSDDFRPPFILARAESQKQKADQVLKLAPETVALLLTTSPANRELLFPRDRRDGARDRVDLKPLGKCLREILISAGLAHGRRDMFHRLRRTSATYLARAAGKAAAQDHLGHSDAKITNLYLDPSLIDRVHAADVLPRPIWSPESE